MVKWFNRAPESVAAVAKFIESNPTLSLPQVSRAPLAILSKCTKQEHVDWLFRSTKAGCGGSCESPEQRALRRVGRPHTRSPTTTPAHPPRLPADRVSISPQL